jgi:RNA polymerase sigma-70 factor (ECF subfamily)
MIELGSRDHEAAMEDAGHDGEVADHPATDALPAVPAPNVSSSFETFFEVEHDGLYGALILVTGSRQEADELMQDAFLRVWQRWNIVQSLANPTGYLYRTAMNLAHSRWRRARVAARRAFEAPSSRDAFEDVEMREDLRRAMSELTPRQRVAIVLTELLGYPSAEAAETMGIRASTVRALTTQARATLRAHLGGDP